MSDRAAAIGIILFIAFVGLILRLTGMRGDLWFEEAWTLETLQRLEYPAQILTIYHHHTNHLLNSIVLHFLPPLQADLVYRLPATAASIAAVPVFWAFAQRQMGNFSFGACLMFALSVPVVAYSTEARGYAFLVLFSLIALLALDANLREEDWRLTALYWLATILAFLSHPSAIVFFGAVFLWSLSIDFGARFTRTFEIIGKCHLVPVAVGTLIYFNFYAFIPPESLGAPEPFTERLISALSVGVGGPEYLDSSFNGVSLARIVAGTVGILLLIEIYLLVVTGGRYWSLYFTGIFVLPYMCYLFPVVRTSSSAYFLLPTVLIYLVLGNFLARLMGAGVLSRTFAVLLVGLFCYGTIATFQGGFDIGRGRVRRAFEYMAQNSQSAEVSIAGDDDIGNELFVGFYLPRLAVSKPIIYRTASEIGAAEVEWYIVRRDKLSGELDHEVVMSGGREFQLKKVFRRMLPSGTNLYIYQRVFEAVG